MSISKLQKSGLIFYMAFLPWMISSFLVQTQFVLKFPELSKLRMIIMIISIILLLVKLFYDRYYTRYNIIFGIIILGIVCLSAWNTENVKLMLTLVSTYLFIFASRNLSVRNILTVSVIVLAGLMSAIHILYVLGYFPDTILSYRDNSVRHALGYTYTTFSSNYLFHVVAIYIFLRDKKITYSEIILFIILNIYFYQKTDTKAVLFFTIILLVVVTLYKLIGFNKNKLWQLIDKYILIISAIVPIWLSYMFSLNSLVFLEINKLLTSRLLLGHTAIQEYGIHLFGTKVTWEFGKGISQIYLYVDSSFLNIAINFGVVILLLFIIGFYKVAKYYEKNIFYTFTFSIIVLHSAFDPQFIELVYNPFLLVLGVLFKEKATIGHEKINL